MGRTAKCFDRSSIVKKKVVATNCPGQDKNLRNIFKNIFLINGFSHHKFSKKLVEIFKKKKFYSFKKKNNSYDIKKSTKIIINEIEKFKVIHFITSLGLGGAELVLFKLLQNKNKFIEHEVICLNSGGVLKKKIEKLKIKVKCLSLEKNFIKNSFACYKYLNTIKKNRIIVQTWLPHADLYGSLVCKLAGLNKIIWNIRISNITFKSFKISTIFIIFFNSLISRLIPAKIISCSKAGIDFHTKIGYKKNLFKLIPNGFDPAKKSIRSNKYSKYFTVGMFSRYHKVKNHQYLFNSIKILQKKISSLKSYCLDQISVNKI